MICLLKWIIVRATVFTNYSHAFRDVSICVTHGTSVLKALSAPTKYFSVKGPVDQKNASISMDDKLCLISMTDEPKAFNKLLQKLLKLSPLCLKFFFFLHMCFLKMLWRTQVLQQPFCLPYLRTELTERKQLKFCLTFQTMFGDSPA